MVLMITAARIDLQVFVAQEGQQDAHAKIEAFQEEEADVQNGDQDKPERVESPSLYLRCSLILSAHQGWQRLARFRQRPSPWLAPGTALAYLTSR